MKRAVLFLLIVFALAGCYDRVDLNEVEIVVAMGLDVAEDGRVKATVQVLNPSPANSIVSGGEPFAKIESVADSFTEAVRKANLYSPNRLYFAHNRLVIFSEDFVNTHGTHHVIDWIMRTDEAREDTFILITSGKASDILASKFPTGSIPAFEITQIVLTNYVNSLAVVTTAFDYAKDRASQIPMTVMGRVEQIKEEDGSLIVYKGAGLIHPHQFMDYLTETETKGYNWLTGRFGTGLIVATVKGGSEKFTYEIVRNRTNLTPKLVDGQLTFVFSAEVTGRITKLESSKSLNDPFSWPEYLHAIEEGIKREVRAAVDKAKEQGDFIGLGHLVMRRLPKFWRENEAQWEQIWPEAPFVFDIKVEINGVGKLIRFL